MNKHVPLPKMMVPVGKDAAGKPVALQFMGRAGPVLLLSLYLKTCRPTPPASASCPHLWKPSLGALMMIYLTKMMAGTRVSSSTPSSP